jgi:coproporphyrinogen III oxidase-like Fe-S oxidoreductase
MPIRRREGTSMPISGGVTERPLLLYVNVPFCNSKCHFCTWVAEVPREDLRLLPTEGPRSRYRQAIGEQVRVHGPRLMARGYRPRIIFWGGGTASILTPEEIGAIHGSISAEFDLSAVVEATIEGSPESFDANKFRLFRELGFNRVSLGVQAFDDTRLRRIGRVHSSDDAVAAIRAASQAGFDNINIDLIVGFPGQTNAEITKSVRTALALPVNHFSVYIFYPVKGTVMHRQLQRGTATVDPQTELDQYFLARDLLEEAGMPEYGTFYFGSPRCEADLAYYQLSMDWLGLGSGANSLINKRALSTHKGRLHEFNARPDRFDAVLPAASPRVLETYFKQAMMTAEGLDARTFEERIGLSLRNACELPTIRHYLDLLSVHGAIEMDDTGIRLRPEDRAAALWWAETAVRLERSGTG